MTTQIDSWNPQRKLDRDRRSTFGLFFAVRHVGPSDRSKFFGRLTSYPALCSRLVFSCRLHHNLRRRPIVFIAHLSFELGQFAPEAAWFGLVFAAFPLLYLTISRRPRQTRRLQSHEVHSSAFCDRRHLIRSGARGRGKPGTRPCVEEDGGFSGRQRNCRLPERPPAWIFVGSKRSPRIGFRSWRGGRSFQDRHA